MKRWILLLGILATIPATLFAQDARLRSGDTIEIRLGGVPSEDVSQVSGNYQVDGEGFVNMPNLGKVKAAGETQEALQTAIESAYRDKQIYTHPTVTVNVSSGARFVNVAGDVRGPRRVEYTPDLTVIAAISACGGFTDYADQTKVRLLREGQVIFINFKEIRSHPEKDVHLKPGDSIEVPQRFW